MKQRLFFIALLFSHTVLAQPDSTWQLLHRVAVKELAFATTDNLDNLYLVSTNGQIKKLDARGDSVAVYNQQKNFGALTSLDVSNPLKLILFYKDYSTVVTLDRWLSSQSTLDLRRSGTLQPTAVGLSNDNLLWVFDGWDNKLKKVDEQGRVLLETSDFRSFFSPAIAPQQIMTENGWVYLVDSVQGIFVFDNYGTYQKKLAFPIAGTVAVSKQLIVYAEPAAVVLYDPVSFREKRLLYPALFSAYKHVHTTANKLVLWSDDEVVIYRFRF